jgi:hypothetical protein
MESRDRKRSVDIGRSEESRSAVCGRSGGFFGGWRNSREIAWVCKRRRRKEIVVNRWGNKRDMHTNTN